jgi:hypothetical protein
MVSGVNAFEISDIQGDETKAVLTRPSKCHSVGLEIGEWSFA